MNDDLIRLKYDQGCRSTIYRERCVTHVNYIEGFVENEFLFGLPILGPEESFNAFYDRAVTKMRDTLIARMLETLKVVRSQDYQPESGKLVLLDFFHLGRREQFRISNILRKNPHYIDDLRKNIKVWQGSQQAPFKRAALHELSWFFWCDPAGADQPGRMTEYNRIMHQLQEMDDAGI